LVSRMPEDGRAVAEAKARGLAPAGVQQPGWRPEDWRRPGCSSRGGGRGVGVRARLVSRMPEDERAVAEGLAAAGASESEARQLGWRRLGRSS
jgi:hypothetical protein